MGAKASGLPELMAVYNNKGFSWFLPAGFWNQFRVEAKIYPTTSCTR